METAGSDDVRTDVPWSGLFRAVVFDLFGTLVPVFDRTAHRAAIRDVAAISDLPFDDVERLWSESYPGRTAGDFPSVAANLEWIGARLDRQFDADRLLAATTRYAQFTRESLVPLPGVLETLAALTEPVGLLTNCAPDVPEEICRSPLAAAFDAAVFSGRDGVRKPDRDAYLAAADRLDVEPGQILYVGDGSDGELTGARAVGMHAVLVRTDLSRTYDRVRIDVTDWTGPTIDRISDLLDYRPSADR